MEIYNLEKYSKSSGRDRDIYVIKDGVHYYFSNDYLLNKKELMWIGDENETVFEYNIDFFITIFLKYKMTFYIDVVLQFMPQSENATFCLVGKDWFNAFNNSGKKMTASYATACSSIEMLEEMKVSKSDVGFFDQIMKDGNIDIIKYAIAEKFAMSDSAIMKIPLIGSIDLNKSVKFDRMNMQTYLFNAMSVNDIASVVWMVRKFNIYVWETVEIFARHSMFE